MPGPDTAHARCGRLSTTPKVRNSGTRTRVFEASALGDGEKIHHREHRGHRGMMEAGKQPGDASRMLAVLGMSARRLKSAMPADAWGSRHYLETARSLMYPL